LVQYVLDQFIILETDSIASFTIETGWQKCHVMWILTNQQGAW